MLKTLAAKHNTTAAKIAAKHMAKIETPHGLRTCFEARIQRDGKPDLLARFGGIPVGGRSEALRARPFRRFRATRLPDRYWRGSRIVSTALAGSQTRFFVQAEPSSSTGWPSSRSGLDLPVSVFAPCLLGCPGITRAIYASGLPAVSQDGERGMTGTALEAREIRKACRRHPVLGRGGPRGHAGTAGGRGQAGRAGSRRLLKILVDTLADVQDWTANLQLLSGLLIRQVHRKYMKGVPEVHARCMTAAGPQRAGPGGCPATGSVRAPGRSGMTPEPVLTGTALSRSRGYCSLSSRQVYPLPRSTLVPPADRRLHRL
jgi:hypothetical protein